MTISSYLMDAKAGIFHKTPKADMWGHHPANDSEAIQQLEALRSKGGEYLLLPQTSFWWLDHYTGLRSHLKHRYHSVWSDSDCIIYSLAERSNGVFSRFRETLIKRLQL